MTLFPRSIIEVGKQDIKRDINLKYNELKINKKDSNYFEFLEQIKKDEFKGKINCTPDPSMNFYQNTNMGLYLELIKQRNQENQNRNENSEVYRQYIQRLKELFLYAKGIVLDIGADNLLEMINLLPAKTSYIPFGPDALISENNEAGAYVQGIGEVLPFIDESLDTVMFNTSLDHILDSNSALKEAYRVLRHEGILIICTLIWLDNLELWRDDVHFHHFTPGEIETLLEKFEIIYLKTYEYQGNSHRYGAYIAARKI